MENKKSISISKSFSQDISVLAVDDEPHGLASLTDMIQHIPNATLCGSASSVSEAIELSSQHHIDLLVLDYHLGDGNGLDISEALNLLHSSIIVSADVSARKDVEKLNIPFLLKPIKSAELETLINQLFPNENKGAR